MLCSSMPPCICAHCSFCQVLLFHYLLIIIPQELVPLSPSWDTKRRAECSTKKRTPLQPFALWLLALHAHILQWTVNLQKKWVLFTVVP